MAEPRGFQYASAAHETDTARAGMWLFLASEMLFFGAIAYVWMVLRITHPQGVVLGTSHTNLILGSINTALLLTSSFTLTLGVMRARAGQGAAAARCCLLTAGLGVGFLALKGLEWGLDLHEGLWPGPGFAPWGDDVGGARLFMCFYWVATALHGLHMVIGVGLLAWAARLAWRGPMAGRHVTAVEVVGLYWSFVDTVWLVMYPLIYLVARP